MKWLILVVYQSPLRSLWLILSPCPWLLLDASLMWMIRIVLLPLGREGEPTCHLLFESDSRFEFNDFKSVSYIVSGCSLLSPTFPTPFYHSPFFSTASFYLYISHCREPKQSNRVPRGVRTSLVANVSGNLIAGLSRMSNDDSDHK
jgi:hypothetical protein